jgi:hypothetical protein
MAGRIMAQLLESTKVPLTPPKVTLDQILETDRDLISEGKEGSNHQIAERLGCSVGEVITVRYQYGNGNEEVEE